jgi:hypothetical protein
MLFDLSDACRMEAFLMREFVEPKEQSSNIGASHGGCLAMNQNVRIEESLHSFILHAQMPNKATLH